MTTVAGLSNEQAAEFLRVDGPNRIDEGPRFSWQKLLLKQFLSPAIVVLIVTACIYGALGNAHDAGILIVIIVPSGLLTFFQEFRAEGTMARLRERLAVRVRVIRDGSESELPIENLVRGDVILLSPGNLVPADLILIDATDLSIDEAALTGEAFPRHKSISDEKELFMGTHVVGGSGLARVVRTGKNTKFGEMAKRIATKDISTSFEENIRDFGFMVAKAIAALIVLVFAGNLLLHRAILESLLFSLALAVGLTPQMLPVIISVCLSAGARQLSRKRVLIKRLDAIEDLGTMEFLCTDKTGTLTSGELSVESAIEVSGKQSERVLRLAFENAALQGSSANAIDSAILRSKTKFSVRKKFGEVGFTFDRRRVSIVTDDGECITKGAYEEVRARSTRVRVGNEIEPLAQRERELEKLHMKWADLGYKIIAVASKQTENVVSPEIESELIFEGLLLINDPPKPDAERAVEALASLGIAIVLITGDSALSARHVAKRVGIPSTHVLCGREIDALSDRQLLERLAEVRVFAEIDPLQKVRVVKVLKEKGAVVGFMGDGINDAAALHLSDVAISVDDAVDVAKEASSIVLLDRDLLVIAEGVKVGRKTFENTMKYVRITISSTFGNVVSMAFASYFLPYLPMLPTQILLLNFLSDLPALAISGDRVDKEELEYVNRWTMKQIARFMIFFGLISSIFDLLVFFFSIKILGASAPELRSTWFACSLMTQVVALSVLRTRRRSWSSRPSALLASTSILVVLVAISVPMFGTLDSFSLPHVKPLFTSEAISLSLLYFITLEFGKRKTKFFI